MVVQTCLLGPVCFCLHSASTTQRCGTEQSALCVSGFLIQGIRRITVLLPKVIVSIKCGDTCKVLTVGTGTQKVSSKCYLLLFYSQEESFVAVKRMRQARNGNKVEILQEILENLFLCVRKSKSKHKSYVFEKTRVYSVS